MKEQSEALSMADMLESEALRWGTPELYKAAAQLRRLHAENERLHQINHAHEMKLSVRGYEIQIADLKAVNQELLEALKNLEKEFRRIYLIYYYAEPWGHETNVPLQAARAAIARAEAK
jgi:ABC-type phosphate transport system auxiliary subunit